MSADAYGTTQPVGITDDVLNLPLPKDPVVSTFTIPTRQHADTPTTLSQAETVSSQINDEEWSKEFHWSEPIPDDDSVTRASGGQPATSESQTGASGGQTGASGGHAGGASAGVFRPVKRQRFCEAPPAYGQPPSKWWDC